MITYSTAVFVYYNGDALRYARINPLTGAHLGLFSDISAPGGYPIFLRVVREIWSALAFTIGIQHCLGVATGLLLYAALRRMGAPRGFALALIFAYIAIANIAGRTDGYSDLEGFQLYGRVAQFADCKKFKPPGRTRLLCQTTPPAQRAGPTSQLFASNLPLNQTAFNLQL